MMLTTCSNARLRGTSSKQSLGKNAPSSVSEDGRLNSPSLSHRSKSSSNLSARATPAPSSPVTSAPAPAPAPALPPAQAVSSAATGDDVLNSYRLPTPYPMWLNPAYAKHIVKGNFMTLSSRPKSVEQGEWMAHQGMLLRPLLFRPSCIADVSRQWLSTTATCGTLSTSYPPRRQMESTSATPPHAPACLPDRTAPSCQHPLQMIC